MAERFEQTARSVGEWIGATPDSKVPDHVRLRIFRREDGRCWISGRKIGPADRWELDHKQALCNGGQHRESNLFPAIVSKHREKTAEDVAERAETDRMAKRHFGIKSKSNSFRKPEGYDPWNRRWRV